MKVRITSPVKGPVKGELHEIGEVIDVTEKVAEGLIKADSAEPVFPKRTRGKAETRPT